MPPTKAVLSKKGRCRRNFSRNLPADFAERVRVNQANLTANLKRPPLRLHRLRLRLLWLGGGAQAGQRIGRPMCYCLRREAADGTSQNVMEAVQWPLKPCKRAQLGFVGAAEPISQRTLHSWPWARYWVRIPASNACLGDTGTRTTGISSHLRRGTRHGINDRWLSIYRRIEDWAWRDRSGISRTGGPVFVQPAPDPNPVAPRCKEPDRGNSNF